MPWPCRRHGGGIASEEAADMRYKGVLFDLDGTLLALDLNQFLSRYFKALAEKVAPAVPPDRFLPALMESTERMLVNDGSKTNSDSFMEHFFQIVDKEPEELLPIFDRFYREDFPRLGAGIEPLPMARKAVDAVLKGGAILVLATNPVFPRQAVDTRLEWAGLADVPFALVTSYENSRYCKPNPGYFADILNQPGLAGEQCLMVGNDTREDTVAGQLGMDTFLVEGHIIEQDDSPPTPWRGDWAQLLELL